MEPRRHSAALPVGGARPSTPSAAKAGLVASNILRADYAGSRACADCHGAIYSAWEASAMRGMTRDIKDAVIRAPFDGAALRVGGDTCTMELRDGARTMRVVPAQGAPETFRVTKVVGGRYREDFVGLDARGEEHVLPATYVFSTHTWRYKGYSVMVKERPRMSTTGRWSRECLPCHNTLPLSTMLYDDIDPAVPAYQGKLSDRVLPRSIWPYAQLARWDRPIGWQLLLWPCWCYKTVTTLLRLRPPLPPPPCCYSKISTSIRTIPGPAPNTRRALTSSSNSAPVPAGHTLPVCPNSTPIS